MGERRSLILYGAGALSGLALAGIGLIAAQGPSGPGVPAEAVALVNRKPILRSDFVLQAQAEHRTLRAMIDEELLVQHGQTIGLAGYAPAVRGALRARVELQVDAEVLAQQPTESQLREYYAAHPERYSSQGSMRLRDFIAGPAGAAALSTALAAAGELRAGAAPDAVMRRHGLRDSGQFMDAGQVDTGEIFDFAARAKLEPRLYQTVRALKSGEVSAPVDSGGQLHLIVMLAHRLPLLQSFEQAHDDVLNDFKKAAAARVREANLRFLQARADIAVAPDLAPYPQSRPRP